MAFSHCRLPDEHINEFVVVSVVTERSQAALCMLLQADADLSNKLRSLVVIRCSSEASGSPVSDRVNVCSHSVRCVYIHITAQYNLICFMSLKRNEQQEKTAHSSQVKRRIKLVQIISFKYRQS